MWLYSERAGEAFVWLGTLTRTSSTSPWCRPGLITPLLMMVIMITVVPPRNHFLFTPLLPSTTVGTLEFRCVQEPVRTIKGVHYLQAQVLVKILEI